MADLIIGMNAVRLNEAIAQLHRNNSIRNRLFKNGQSGNFSGLPYKGTWDVQAAPTIELRPPTNAEWGKSIRADGSKGVPTDNAFITNLSKLAVSLTTAGETKNSVLPVKAICTANVVRGKVTLTTHSIIVNTSGLSPIDEFFIIGILVPQVLAAVNATLSGVKIPAPRFMGVSLTHPAVDIVNSRLIVAFNMIQHSQPIVQGPFPNSHPFFILTSRALNQAVVNYVVSRNIQGKSFKKRGSEGAAGFSATYEARGKVQGIKVSTTNVPTRLKTNVDLRMSASAGINTPVGMVINAAGNVVKDVADAIVDAGEKVINVFNPSKW